MKTIKELIKKLKGGKSAYECKQICLQALKSINKEYLNQVNEMIEYYDNIHESSREIDFTNTIDITDLLLEVELSKGINPIEITDNKLHITGNIIINDKESSHISNNNINFTYEITAFLNNKKINITYNNYIIENNYVSELFN